MTTTRIQPKVLFEIAPDFEGVIAIPGAVGMTQKRYCSRVHAKGDCTGECEENCGEYIGRAFQELIDHPNPYSPVGLLTVILRGETAKHAEHKSQERRNIPEVITAIDDILVGLGT